MRLRSVCSLAALVLYGAFRCAAESSGPQMLTFAELRAAASEQADPDLLHRIDDVLKTPFVIRSDSAVPKQSTPRIAFWNIERGRNLAALKAVLTGDSALRSLPGLQSHLSREKLAAISAEADLLRTSDVLILNEADIGMKRSDYADLPAELASVLKMHSAFGVEFLELDRLYTGDEQPDLGDAPSNARLAEALRVDPSRYRGLHGNAVLSRYPIRSVRIHPLPACYDWFGKEMQDIATLEKGRRWSAKKAFSERIQRQVRRGGRMALIVELDTPHLPGGVLTVVSTHLEDRAPSSCRLEQMEDLMAVLGPVQHTVVVGGDLNTSGSDGTPTSFRHEVMKRITDEKFWARQAVHWFSPVAIPRLLLFPFNYLKNFRDPTAVSIPLLASNRARPMFNAMRSFRFADGGQFDFSGSPPRSGNGRGRTLANSNERAWKGFHPTYQFERNYFGLVGTFRLDWLLVKPAVEGSTPRPLPQHPRTLSKLNTSVTDRISDHHPIVLDLFLP